MKPSRPGLPFPFRLLRPAMAALGAAFLFLTLLAIYAPDRTERIQQVERNLRRQRENTLLLQKKVDSLRKKAERYERAAFELEAHAIGTLGSLRSRIEQLEGAE